jgi:hypothetical protein
VTFETAISRHRPNRWWLAVGTVLAIAGLLVILVPHATTHGAYTEMFIAAPMFGSGAMVIGGYLVRAGASQRTRAVGWVASALGGLVLVLVVAYLQVAF